MKIAIIGAGLTAATIAQKLTTEQPEWSVTIFEKSRGAGGRMTTKRRDMGWLDMGAQYFTARSDAFQQEVEAWVDAGWANIWDGSLFTFEKGSLKPSDDDQTRYIGTPYMNSPVSERIEASGAELICNIRISQLHWAEGYWKLVDDQGNHHGPFDRVISTVPCEQAKELVRGQSELAAALEGFRMAPTWSAAIQFEHDITEKLDELPDGMFVKSGPVSWISRNGSRQERAEQQASEVWIVHFGPYWSQRYLEQEPEFIKKSAREELRRVLQVKLPEISQAIMHRWRYARNAEESKTDETGYLIDPTETLMVAGDWVMGGRVESAFLSGRAVADRLDELTWGYDSHK